MEELEKLKILLEEEGATEVRFGGESIYFRFNGQSYTIKLLNGSKGKKYSLYKVPKHDGYFDEFGDLINKVFKV